eukprot:Lithocolla_globosa_v1_NODE_1754_length_2361_cov_8.908066.p2 type:complete len:149 gc:universal NODE_1754_length_2361_cov_8.908066:996-1442(+)
MLDQMHRAKGALSNQLDHGKIGQVRCRAQLDVQRGRDQIDQHAHPRPNEKLTRHQRAVVVGSLHQRPSSEIRVGGQFFNGIHQGLAVGQLILVAHKHAIGHGDGVQLPQEIRREHGRPHRARHSKARSRCRSRFQIQLIFREVKTIPV